MPSVIACFSPNDTLLVDQAAVIRVVDYAEPSVTLEIRATSHAQPVSIAVGSEWLNVVGALEARYRGIFINEKCQPARLARIEFRDTGAIDVLRHSSADVPIVGARPMGRGRPPGGAH
jgi:hypothetical protein